MAKNKTAPKYARYQAEQHREKNQARKLERYLRGNPNDLQTTEFLVKLKAKIK